MRSTRHASALPPTLFAGFIWHSLAAMAGGAACAAGLTILLLHGRGGEAAMWYSPLIWLPGLLLGAASNRRRREPAACFAWLSGALVLGTLMLLLLWLTNNWARTRADIFPLSHLEESIDDELGFYQLFFVWPAVNAFTYSLGAMLPLLFPVRERKESSSYSMFYVRQR